jgi:hypothetical protein
VAEPGLVGIRRRADQRDVRHEQHDGGRRDAAVPDADAVEAAEGAFDRRRQRREHERARQQQHGFGAAQLGREPARRLTGRAGEDPQDRIESRYGDESRRAQRRTARGHVHATSVAPVRDARSPDFAQARRDATDSAASG